LIEHEEIAESKDHAGCVKEDQSAQIFPKTWVSVKNGNHVSNEPHDDVYDETKNSHCGYEGCLQSSQRVVGHKVSRGRYQQTLNSIFLMKMIVIKRRLKAKNAVDKARQVSNVSAPKTLSRATGKATRRATRSLSQSFFFLRLICSTHLEFPSEV